jgi:hypothetical protein
MHNKNTTKTTPLLPLQLMLLLFLSATTAAVSSSSSSVFVGFPENCSFAVLGSSQRLFPVSMCQSWAPLLCSCTYFDTREIITIVLWGASALFIIVCVPKQKMSCPARIAYMFISLWMSAVWEFSCLALIIYLIVYAFLRAMIYFNGAFDTCFDQCSSSSSMDQRRRLVVVGSWRRVAAASSSSAVPG